jgi:hypothetical protein
MSKFSTGDRVRIVRWMWPYSPARLWIGRLGTIKRVDRLANGHCKYDVTIDTLWTTHYLDERELSLAREDDSSEPRRRSRHPAAASRRQAASRVDR